MAYTNEEKSIASKRMKQDPQIKFYTDQINGIHALWSDPQLFIHGEAVLLDKIPEMPEDVKAKIEYFKSEREKYIKEIYPELSSD